MNQPLDGDASRACRRSWRYRISAGVVALALCVAASAYLPGIAVLVHADHATGVAEVGEISLADGRRIVLGAQSAISVRMSPAGHEVRLLRGQAWFDAAAGADQALVVLAGTVRLRGGSFDVLLQPEGVLIGAGQGEVVVNDGARILQEGEWVREGRDGSIEAGKQPSDLIGEWRSGRLTVENRPVVEIARTLGRYLPGGVLVAGNELARLRVSGSFDLGDPEDSLERLRRSYGGDLRWLPDGGAILLEPPTPAVLHPARR